MNSTTDAVLCSVGVIGILGTSVNIVCIHELDVRGWIPSRSKIFSSRCFQTDLGPLRAPEHVDTGLEVFIDPGLIAQVRFVSGPGSNVSNQT
jgi:hypothetical protein